MSVYNKLIVPKHKRKYYIKGGFFYKSYRNKALVKKEFLHALRVFSVLKSTFVRPLATENEYIKYPLLENFVTLKELLKTIAWYNHRYIIIVASLWLAKLHRKSIIHGDFCIDNIGIQFLQDRCEFKLIDASFSFLCENELDYSKDAQVCELALFAFSYVMYITKFLFQLDLLSVYKMISNVRLFINSYFVYYGQKISKLTLRREILKVGIRGAKLFNKLNNYLSISLKILILEFIV